MADERRPKAGEIWSFQHAPATEVSPPIRGRYSALKVLEETERCGGRQIAFLVLDGVFPHAPSMAEVQALPALRNIRFSCQGEPAVCSTNPEWDIGLHEFRFVGETVLSVSDYQALRSCRSFGTWLVANAQAEGEWRWKNDSAAYQAEVAEARRLRDARRTEQRRRHQRRLSSSSLEELLHVDLLPNWDERKFLPAPFVSEVRGHIRSAVEALAQLGRKPKKGEVRSALKSRVDRIREADVAAEYIMETEEREELAILLGDIASLAGHASLRDEIGRWVFLS